MDPISHDTNITANDHAIFQALTSGEYDNFALFSCFVDGKPATAIVAITQSDDGQYLVTPLFVSITAQMCLTNHDGEEAIA